MKNIWTILFISGLLFSCAPTQKLPKEEYDKFKLESNEVFYEGKAVAKVGNLEYEYTNGKFQVEVSLVQYSGAYNEMTKKIAMFVATKYPDAKIEVKVVRDEENDPVK